MDKQYLSKPRRKSIRLKGWDYRSPGYYFATICTYQREPIFTNSTFRELAQNAICEIPNRDHARHVYIDESIVMDDHVHTIIVFNNYPPQADLSTTQGKFENALVGSLGVIVGQYKSIVARQINQIRRSVGSQVWQRRYYERIIRNERELQATREYIRNNPIRAEEKRDNLDRLLGKMNYHP